jgi:hypothetical protein
MWNVFVNDLRDLINYSRYSFLSDIKIYLAGKSPKYWNCYYLVLILYEVGALLTSSNTILVKPDLYNSQENLENSPEVKKLSILQIQYWLYSNALEYIRLIDSISTDTPAMYFFNVWSCWA